MTFEERKVEKIKNLCKNAEHSMRQTMDSFYEDKTGGDVALLLMRLSISSVFTQILAIVGSLDPEKFNEGGIELKDGELIVNPTNQQR